MAAAISDALIQLVEEGHLAEAREKFWELYEQDMNDAEVLYYLGLIHFKQDDYDSAIDFLSKSIDINPNDYRTHEVLGQAFGLKSENAGVVKSAMLIPKIKKAFQKALELNPQALGALEGLFMFYLFAPPVAGGDEKKAVEYLEYIEQANPARGHLASGLFHTRHQNFDKAQEAFTKALDNGSDDGDILLKAGRFFLNHSQLDKAKDAFQKLTELKKEDPTGYDALGEALFKEGQWAEALTQFDTALQKNSSFYPARLHRADALVKLNRAEEARQEYQTIIKEHKGSSAAAKAKEALSRLK